MTISDSENATPYYQPNVIKVDIENREEAIVIMEALVVYLTKVFGQYRFISSLNRQINFLKRLA
jgi:hypothetical protein